MNKLLQFHAKIVVFKIAYQKQISRVQSLAPRLQAHNSLGIFEAQLWHWQGSRPGTQSHLATERLQNHS